MVTEKERTAAKWVRRFEEVSEEELQLAYKICEKILKIRDYRKSWENFIERQFERMRYEAINMRKG